MTACGSFWRNTTGLPTDYLRAKSGRTGAATGTSWRKPSTPPRGRSRAKVRLEGLGGEIPFDCFTSDGKVVFYKAGSFTPFPTTSTSTTMELWNSGERFANHRLVTGGRTAEGSDSSQVTNLPLVGQPIG